MRILFAMALGWLVWSAAGSASAVRDAANLPVQQLESLVVQDYGFEKSLLTFADERLGLIAHRAQLPSQHPIATVLGMIFEAQDWRRQPLFKIEHPDLIQLFGNRKFITADDFLNETNMDKLRHLIETKPSAETAVDDLNRRVQAFLELENELAIVPRPQGDWATPDALARAASLNPADQAIVSAFEALKNAYLKRDAAAFGTAAGELLQANREAARAAGVTDFRLRVDLLNTRLRAFRWSAALYLLATLSYLGALAFRGGKPLVWAGLGLLSLGFLCQAAGLTLRTFLVGRAPMSNMYESLVFAVGGMVAIAAILDRLYKNPLFGLAGGLLGFIFLVIAVKMPVHQSRVSQLMPALQSSWLTYHVTTVMLSYSAFALSFFVSLIYLLKALAGGDAAPLRLLQSLPSLETLDFFNYRIIAVGFPLLTIGIFTGAVWAATAWGRPWAFDPKETWSAITWLIYGVYLHTRFLSGWKGTRSAVLAVIGFLAVLFTYLGVNFLLPGLHSYAA